MISKVLSGLGKGKLTENANPGIVAGANCELGAIKTVIKNQIVNFKRYYRIEIQAVNLYYKSLKTHN